MFRSALVRLVLPVALASCVVAYFGLPYIDKLLTEWFLGDIEMRAQLLMSSMQQPVSELVAKDDQAKLRHYSAHITADKRLLAIAVCRPSGSTIVRTDMMPAAVSCELESKANEAAERTVSLPSGSVQISRFDFDSAQVPYRVLLAARFELRRPKAADCAGFHFPVRRHRRGPARDVRRARRVAATQALDQGADRRYPRGEISRRCRIFALRRGRYYPRSARRSPKSRKHSDWKSIFAKTGRRTRCGKSSPAI